MAQNEGYKPALSLFIQAEGQKWRFRFPYGVLIPEVNESFSITPELDDKPIWLRVTRRWLNYGHQVDPDNPEDYSGPFVALFCERTTEEAARGEFHTDEILREVPNLGFYGPDSIN